MYKESISGKIFKVFNYIIKDLMWALLVPLSKNWNLRQSKELLFDNEVWEDIVAQCIESRINTIVFDLLDGLCYGSHPEIALPGAWTRQRLKKEIKRLNENGITAIPKLNFSATHDGWMKHYERMLSTPEYYRVCRDLIHEVAVLFDNPRYIHLGMDEENAKNAALSALAVYRHKDLLWHDLQFLCDCVRDTGATPWIWADPCFDNREAFLKNIGTEDIVLSPWMYNALKREHWTPINSRQAYIDYYAREPYASMNLQYVEQEPFVTEFMEKAPKCIADGYSLVPCVSSINQCRYNATDTLEYFKEKADAKQLVGFITSPWLCAIADNKERIINDIRWYRQAIDEVYNDIKISEEDRVNIAYDTLAADHVY